MRFAELWHIDLAPKNNYSPEVLWGKKIKGKKLKKIRKGRMAVICVVGKLLCACLQGGRGSAAKCLVPSLSPALGTSVSRAAPASPPYSLPASGEGRQQGLRSPWGLKRILSSVWWAERWESPRNEVPTSPGTRAGSLQAERAALQGEGVTVHGYFGILFSFPTCCFYSLVLFTF